ncbi:uncharacterized protein LOC142351936 isoform X2 [Convolutriloba macropyga]
MVGQIQCSGIIWITNQDGQASVKINPPVDLYVIPTTPTTTTSTTTTVPSTTTIRAPATVKTTSKPRKTTLGYMAPVVIPTPQTKRQIITAPSVTKSPINAPKQQSPPTNKNQSTRKPIVLPSGAVNSKTTGSSKRKDSVMTTDSGQSIVAVTVSPKSSQPVPESSVDKFKKWLSQNGLKSMSDACSLWAINLTYDTKLNATAVRKILQASCSDSNFKVALFFAFDFDIKRQNFDRPWLAFYNETSWGFQYSNDSSSIWVENRYNYQVVTLPKVMQKMVRQQCPGLQTSISSFTKKNESRYYYYTKVICTRVTSKSLYMKSFTPSDSEPVFKRIYSEMPYYVREVYKSGFSRYRTVLDYELLVSVNKSVIKMTKVKDELKKLGCQSGEYSIKLAHVDIKVDCSSYFVELICKKMPDRVFYLEYEKPDFPQTQITLESVDMVPKQLKSAQSLLHPKYTLVLKSFKIYDLLKQTLNLNAAVKASNCTDYSVMLTYENLVVELSRRVYLVIMYCPRRTIGDRVMYAVITTVVDADWFSPVLIDKLRNRPPDGF